MNLKKKSAVNQSAKLPVTNLKKYLQHSPNYRDNRRKGEHYQLHQSLAYKFGIILLFMHLNIHISTIVE